jgi:hypothetical protein
MIMAVLALSHDAHVSRSDVICFHARNCRKA